MQIAWPISGLDVFSRASMFAGDMFLPAALMISSFLRSTIVTKPSASISATSPVCSQPSASIASAVFSGSWRYPAIRIGAAGEQLAVVGELHLDAGDRLADRPEPLGARRVGGRDAARAPTSPRPR